MIAPTLPHFDAWLEAHGPEQPPSIESLDVQERIAAWESHAYGAWLCGIDHRPLLREAWALADLERNLQLARAYWDGNG